jgi:MYXO-CTERM domain-containing protein
VRLALGSHTVEWSASDGTNTTKAQQTVTVLIAIQASQSFLVDDRAQLKTATGGFAAVLNAGSGATRLGIDAHTGSIQSLGGVSSFDRARVEGNIVTAGTYTPGNASVVTGTVTQHASVSFPAAPTLPTFPTPSGANAIVNSGSTYAPAPGSYPSLTVNSAATLVLAAGDYYFTTLVINGSATVRANAATRVFARNQLTLGSSVRTSSGALAPIMLGFAGTSFSLGVAFTGTLIAPNAALSIGSGSNLSFAGSFFAKTIELQPAVVVTCSAPAAPVMQALSVTVNRSLVSLENAAGDGSGSPGAAGCACSVSTTAAPPSGAATILAGLLLLRRTRRRRR